MKRTTAIAATLFALLALTPTASADKTISEPGEGAGQTKSPQGLAIDSETGRLYVADQGNRRIDVFDSTGAFEFAFGWGVANGKAELQSCGPKATPPTTKCSKGLEGGGAGEFTQLGDIAVDNDPSSPSQHDVYVVDSGGSNGRDSRIQKFDPEGNFLLTFGGGVISGGAKGSGNLVSGSTEVTSVKTTEKAFEVNQTITGAGIPAETKVIALGPGTITLSKPATAAGTGVALSVAEGPGNDPVNEKQVWTITSVNPDFPTKGLFFTTPDPSPSESSTQISLVSPPPASGPGSLQEALEDLPNIGTGNVKVTGATGGPYTIEFAGARFADTDVSQITGQGSGDSPINTVQNGASAAEVCTAAIAGSCKGGIEGAGDGQFSRGVHLAVGSGGTVYIADCLPVDGGSEAGGHCGNRLQKFEPTGAFVEELALPQSQAQPNGVAVDSSGDFYVSVNNAIRKYDPAATLIGQLSVGSEVGSLAVDNVDNLFSAESDGSTRSVIAEYNSAGNTLRRFGYDLLKGRPNGLAPYQSPSGDLYTAEGDNVFYRSFPPPGPIAAPRPCATSLLGNSKATLLAEINPEGKATSFQFEYVDQKSFEDEEGFKSKNTKTTASEPVGSDFFLHKAAAQAEVDPETKYHCRVIATNADAPGGVEGPEGTFTSKEPLEIGTTTVSDVSTEAATLNATVNPLGLKASGYFEYVTEATYLKDIAELGPEHGFDHASKAPDVDAAEEPIDFGAGEDFEAGSAALAGLKPGTSYRFRVVATDVKLAPKGIEIAGPTKGFRTFGSAAGRLPDDRRYELVSPGQKNSAEVAVPGPAGGFKEDRNIRIQAGAGSGDAVTYTSWTSFGDAEGAPAANQYLSKRSEAGWATENISPFGFQANPLNPPFSGFDAELGLGALKVSEPALTADCPEGFENLYLRDNEGGALRCLTPEAPDLTKGIQICFLYAGASEDGSRAFFAADASYAGTPKGDLFKFHLYEWSAATGLRPVSILPGQSEAVSPTAATSLFGPRGSLSEAENCQFGRTNLRHVVSADGTRAFWTYTPEDASKPSRLLVRVDGSETVQLDAAQGVAEKNSGNGIFWAASANGSVAYFTDENRLVSGSKAEKGAADLYRYELDKPIGSRLANLTKASTSNGPAGVQGVVGASDDGSYVYFVAKGVLSEEANAAGQKAIEGKDNLYLHHEGKTSFIATLSVEDNRDWESQPKTISARVSPDGRHLAFLTIEAEALVGYDNRIAKGEHCQFDQFGKLINSPLCSQAFIYDAETQELTCASCSPSGARPLGPTLLPGWTNVYEGPRYLSDDGSRLFFETHDALAAADENGKRDVYEFEAEGKGSCNSASPAFDPAADGCHFLISSGQGSDESFLVDASSDGRDVFVSTRDVLNGWDVNENFDIYDAREGGGFPEPPVPVAPCVGEACKPPPPAPPATSSPPRVEGPGNQVQKPRKHRGKKKHKKKKKTGRAAHKRGAKR